MWAIDIRAKWVIYLISHFSIAFLVLVLLVAFVLELHI